MNDGKTPRNQEGQPPTTRGSDTAERLKEKADAQRGEANRARTEEKARAARGDGKGRDRGDGKGRDRGDGKGRVVRFGG